MAEPDFPDFGAHPRNIQYTTKAARLLNQTETGVARVFAEQSENFLERQYGTVFAVIDLGFTSDFYDVSEVLVDTLRKDFYADLNVPVEQSFERALTGINQTLADLAAEGQNDWVGQLNALVGVIHENELYLSQVGKAEAYLVRGPSVTHITDGLKSDNAASAKTFQNLASGDLEVGDKLLFATDELFNHLSVHDIRRHLYLHPPTRAIRKMADQLTQGGQPGRLAVATIELTTIDLISAETVSDEPDEIILGAPRRHFETLQRFKPFRKDTPIAELSGKAKKHWEKRIAPKVARHATEAKHRARTFVAKRRGETPPPPPRPAAGTPETQSRSAQGKGAGERVSGLKRHAAATAGKMGERMGPVVGRGKGAARKLWQKTRIPETAAWQKFRRGISPATRRLAAWWRKAGQNKRTALYRNLIIGIALVLVLSLALSISAGQSRQDEARIKERITQVQELQAKAEASFIFKDVAGARAQIAEAKREADTLAKEKKLKGETAQLQQSVDGSFDRINNIVTVSNQPLADFGSVAGQTSLTNLAQSGTTFYAIGKTGGLRSFNQTNKETKTVNDDPFPGTTVSGVTTTTNGDVLFLTEKPGIYQLDTTGTIAEVGLTAGATWEKGRALDAVQQNIFILDPGQNQIWRHTRAQSSANKGESYLTAPTDVRDGIDLVTGAQVYVLKEGGGVLQFTAGSQQPFTLQAPPAPVDSLRGAKAITANFATNTLYLADPAHKRVVEYTIRGEYQRQFRGEAFGEIKDLVVDDKTNTLYVLSGNKVYEVKLATTP